MYKYLICSVLIALSFTIHGKEASEKRDVKYGSYDRSKLDFWQAKSNKKTPVVIFFHGGGFKGGDKNHIRHFIPINDYLKKGVSCITVNYPFLKHTNNDYLAIMKECKVALNFIIGKKNAWNIDTDRIASVGCSAGTLITQWLGNNTNDISVMGAFMQPIGTNYFVIPGLKKTTPPLFIYQQNPSSDRIHHPSYASNLKKAFDSKQVECVLWGTGKNGIEKLPQGKDPKQEMKAFFFKQWGVK